MTRRPTAKARRETKANLDRDGTGDAGTDAQGRDAERMAGERTGLFGSDGGVSGERAAEVSVVFPSVARAGCFFPPVPA